MVNIYELTKIIESSNLNFLIGAGLSQDFLPILGNIENELSAEQDETRRIPIYKKYFQKVMVPNLDIVDGTVNVNNNEAFKATYGNYKKFFDLISYILLKRKNTILSKQANIFTTNIDIFIETALEEGSSDYNDGFAGQIHPTFSISNFKKSIFKRSLHFENISEIPVFNLIKIHGSLTWRKDGEAIVFSKLQHFDKSLATKVGNEFKLGYDQIVIVNPEPEKLKKSVMDLIHYELLRMYSSELEKENTVLFIMGFSMEDAHIKEITIRSANSNPTLKIYIFCFSQNGAQKMEAKMELNKLKYSNIEIISPEDDTEDKKYNLSRINNDIFSQIIKESNSIENHGE